MCISESWEENWVYSKHPGKEFGKFKLTAGKFYNDAEKDKGNLIMGAWRMLLHENVWNFQTNLDNIVTGIQTSEDAKFYAISRKFKPFSNKDKPLVIQFTVKHEQNIDCGGGYVKLFDCSLNQEDMHGESPYLFMFGKKYVMNEFEWIYTMTSIPGGLWYCQSDVLFLFSTICSMFTNLYHWWNSLIERKLAWESWYEMVRIIRM